MNWSGEFMWVSLGTFSVAFWTAVCAWMSTGKVKAAYFDALWCSTNWYETTSFLRVFRCAMYSCMLASLYKFVVLKHAVLCCHFKGKFLWTCCCLDVCLIRFSEPLPLYFAFAINWHFQACHYVCHEATSTFNILTFSSQFTASHYGIRCNLRATSVSTVYDVKIATQIWTEEKVSASQTNARKTACQTSQARHDATCFTLVTR